MAGLFLAPHVESLVHHDEAHTVAKVEQLRCRRVMGTTDSVATHFFQNLQLAFDGARIHRSSQATQVMMHADTVYLHLFTIQDKSFLCIEAESTDAGRSIITVEYLAGLFILEDAFYLIHIRCINTPEIRILQFYFLLHFCRSDRHQLSFRHSLTYHMTVGIH